MIARKVTVAGLMLGVLCMSASIAPPSADAQIPDKFTNLKVLPKDTSKRALLETMKGFAIGLGVRCHHCHVGEEGQPLSEFDFASDEKEAKQKARVMMQLNAEINDRLLPELGDLRSPSISVNCVTCHRGQPVPRMLEDVLAETVVNDGVAPAIEQYRELREQFYGGFSYDFGEMTLVNLATALQEDHADAAVAMLQLNLEFHSESWMTLVSLGDAYAKSGNKVDALSTLEKAMAIRAHPMLQQKIKTISGE